MNIPEIRDIGQGNSGWLLPHPITPYFSYALTLASYPTQNGMSIACTEESPCCFKVSFQLVT